jgi:hypothetical protein
MRREKTPRAQRLSLWTNKLRGTVGEVQSSLRTAEFRQRKKRIDAEKLQERTRNGIAWHLNRVAKKSDKNKSIKDATDVRHVTKEKVTPMKKPPVKEVSSDKPSNATRIKLEEYSKRTSTSLETPTKDSPKQKAAATKAPISIEDNPDPVFTEFPASPRKGETVSIGDVVESALKRIDGLLKNTDLTSPVHSIQANVAAYGPQESLIWQPHMDSPVKYKYNLSGDLIIENNTHENTLTTQRSFEWAKSGGVAVAAHPKGLPAVLQQRSPETPQAPKVRCKHLSIYFWLISYFFTFSLEYQEINHGIIASLSLFQCKQK